MIKETNPGFNHRKKRHEKRSIQAASDLHDFENNFIDKRLAEVGISREIYDEVDPEKN